MGVRVDPQRSSAELSGGSATSCGGRGGGQTPLTPPSNTALRSGTNQFVSPSAKNRNRLLAQVNFFRNLRYS